jgi:hypothetical protein
MVRVAVTSGAAKRREACGGDGLPELETGGEDVDHWLQHPLNRCIARGGGGKMAGRSDVGAWGYMHDRRGVLWIR